jgi:hypothetical protein
VSLDLDRPRLEADESMGDCAREHVVDATAGERAYGAQTRADFVLIERDAGDAPTAHGDSLEADVEAGELGA